ncbi:MAG: pyruvate kinase, partial [Duncaniella sp.]|nr:pyruvate kinase [Duncaniella sp.]
AIFTDAFHGTSARFIASFRGNNPTFAICHNVEVQRWLALSYGVSAYYFPHEGEVAPRHSVEAIRQIMDEDRISPDDRIAYLTGTRRGARALEILTPGEIIDME